MMDEDKDIEVKQSFNFAYWWRISLTRIQRALIVSSGIIGSIIWVIVIALFFKIGWWPVGTFMILALIFGFATLMIYDLGNEYDKTGRITYDRRF
jgi:hypothetical protein